MKVSIENIEKMKQYINTVLNYYKVDTTNKIDENQYFFVWGKVSDSIRYQDSNRNVLKIDDKRIFEYDPNFNYYIDGTNDKSLFTALKSVFNSLNK